MRRVLLTLAVWLYAALVFAQQPKTSGSITAGGADCSVAARCVGLQVGRDGGSATIQASGFGTATVTIETSIDATSVADTGHQWNAALDAFAIGGTSTSATFSANGVYVVPVRAGQWVRARASAYTSGTIAITLGSSAAPVAFAPAIPQTVTANAGTNLNTSALALDATLTGGTQKTKIIDSGGTNVATVSAAGAVKTDNSAVVQPGSIADGSDVTLGAKADNKSTATDTTAITLMAIMKEVSFMEQNPASRAVTNAGTFAVQAAQSGNWTSRTVGNIGAVIDFAGQNAASPANAFLMGGQFNTTPTTITTGNASPLQLDNAGNLLVNIKAGGGSGGGPADVGTTTAASETDAARQKVTSALRLLDTAQGAGSQLVGAKGDQTSGMWVNCKAGCSAAGDTTGSTQTYNASGQSATVTMAGENAASFALTSAASPVLTLVAECSADGGATYGGTVAFVTTAGVYATSLANPANATYALIMPTGCAGATNVRVRSSAYTSGTIVGQLRSTANSPYANPALGAIGANSYPNAATAVMAQDSSTATTSRALKATANGLQVDGSAGTFPATESGTWTVQPGNTANTTPWLMTPYESGANLFPAAAALADATANPTTTGLASFNMCFNGTTWDRCKSSSTNTGTLDSGTQRVTLATNDPLIGTAGTSSAEVLTVQGRASMTPLNDNITQVNGSAIATSATGVIKVGVTGNTGAAVDAAGQNVASPANELLVGGQFNTSPTTLTTGNMSPLQLTSAGRLITDGSQVTQPVSGTVTANIGTTNGLALDASVTGLEVAQASTTSGQKGALVQGAVTTAAPTYTTAQTSPLSLTTAGALRVDGSGVTQPVSGTVTTTPPANASTNVAQFAGTNVSTGTGAGGAGIPRVTLSNDSSLAANQSVNVSQFGGSNAATGTGASGAGIPRVTVANDSNVLATQSGTWTVQPGNTPNTTPWLQTISQGGNAAVVSTAGALASNLTQVGGTSYALGSATQAVSLPVTIAKDDPFFTELVQRLGYSPSAGATGLKGSFGRSITSTGDALDVNVKYAPASLDACSGAKFNVAISQTTNTVLRTGAAGRYAICSITIVGADAENIALVEGTGATCGTGTAGVIGGSTAATGPNFAANGGFAQGNGAGTVAIQATAGNDLCLLQSGSGRVAGNLTYALQR